MILDLPEKKGTGGNGHHWQILTERAEVYSFMTRSFLSHNDIFFLSETARRIVSSR